MRPLRIKPEGMDCWYHCCNRISGRPGDTPLGRADKEAFLSIVRRLSRLYTIRVCAFMVMDNHVHLLVRVPGSLPSPDDVLRRYSAYHHGNRHLDPHGPQVVQWQERLRDISAFMGQLERMFTLWYNRQHGRRGCLWGGRFRSSLLEAGESLWRCWKYIECNPIRAGIVKRAADYRFGSFGAWFMRGTHVFNEEFSADLFPAMREYLGVQTESDLMTRMAAALSEAGDPSAPAIVRTQCMRRLRYWTDGLVIGSEMFIRKIMSEYGNPSDRRLYQPEDAGSLCWHPLRRVPAAT
ncbi:MAG: transposase [Kiritimatiellae bacterium]|nr:transposase [Kiritimatiellia bacterium]